MVVGGDGRVVRRTTIPTSAVGEPRSLVDGIVATLRRVLDALGAEGELVPGGSVVLETNAREMRLYPDAASERLTFGGPGSVTEVNGKMQGAFPGSVRGFLAAVRIRDLDLPTSAANTLYLVEVQEAIVRSAQSGTVVRL